jgi:23S rRNA pseudouridine2605 synthase
MVPPRKPRNTRSGPSRPGTSSARSAGASDRSGKGGEARSSKPVNENHRAAQAWGVAPDRPKRDSKNVKTEKAAKAERANRGDRPVRSGTGPRPAIRTEGDPRSPARWEGAERTRQQAGGEGRGAAARGLAEKPVRPPRKPRAHAPHKPTTNPHPARAGAPAGEGPQRIAKLLARAGVASRREIERMIEEGRIALNGVPVATPATLLTTLAGVSVDGNMVAEPEGARLFLFHKPSGYLTTERDPMGRPTIYDKLPADLPRVMPVGRLDMTTEGLLLLTTDGGLKRQMELPSTGVERCYRARAFGEVSQAQLEELALGVEVEGIRYGRIDANLERRTGRNQWIEMTLTEGKNREVRRVLEYLDLKVNRLIRTRYGIFELGDLPPGAVVEVRQHELELFRKSMRQRG